MTKKLLLSLAAFLLFVTVRPTLCLAQIAPAAPPQAPTALTPAIAPAALTDIMAVEPAAAPPQEAAPLAPATPPVAPVFEMPFAFGSAFFQGDNYLGVSVEDVTRQNMGRYGLAGEPRGVAVTRVVKGSPAERAGLRENDVILKYDGEPVGTYRKLNRLIDESSPEHNARLTIHRGGSEQEVSITLGKREGNFAQVFGGTDLLRAEELRRRAEEGRGRGEEERRRADEARRRWDEMRRNNQGSFSFGFGAGRRIGVSTTPLSKQLSDYFGAPGHGVIISSVTENSPADKAGLRAGDVITEADGQRIEQAGDLSRAINRRDDDGEITLTVVRDKKQRTFKVRPERSESPGFVIPAISVNSPVATIALPRIDVTLPTITVNAPRVNVAPRVRTVTPVRPATRVRRPIRLEPIL